MPPPTPPPTPRAPSEAAAEDDEGGIGGGGGRLAPSSRPETWSTAFIDSDSLVAFPEDDDDEDDDDVEGGSTLTQTSCPLLTRSFAETFLDAAADDGEIAEEWTSPSGPLPPLSEEAAEGFETPYSSIKAPKSITPVTRPR